MAKVDVPLPPGFMSAIQQLVDSRNRHSGPEHRRIYARDLHEEAVAELIQRVEAGERILFLAPPSGKARKSLWLDEKLKAGVDRLAGEHSVTRAAVVMTAFHSYLCRLGVLPETLAA